MTYVLTGTIDADVDTAESRIREALQAEGFGILTEIDLQATLKAKLGHEIPAYRILGACNPPLAKQAHEADVHVGALLPCNVVVHDVGGGRSEIAIADPNAMLALGGEALSDLATQARARLESALATAVG